MQEDNSGKEERMNPVSVLKKVLDFRNVTNGSKINEKQSSRRTTREIQSNALGGKEECGKENNDSGLIMRATGRSEKRPHRPPLRTREARTPEKLDRGRPHRGEIRVEPYAIHFVRNQKNTGAKARNLGIMTWEYDFPLTSIL